MLTAVNLLLPGEWKSTKLPGHSGAPHGPKFLTLSCHGPSNTVGDSLPGRKCKAVQGGSSTSMLMHALTSSSSSASSPSA